MIVGKKPYRFGLSFLYAVPETKPSIVMIRNTAFTGLWALCFADRSMIASGT